MKAKKYSWRALRWRGACYNNEKLKATVPHPMTALELLTLKIPVKDRAWLLKYGIKDDPGLAEWHTWMAGRTTATADPYAYNERFRITAIRKAVAILKAKEGVK